jgi:hypothetical protein
MCQRIREKQAAELDRLEATGQISLEWLAAQRARLGGPSVRAVLVDDETDCQGRVIGLAEAIELPETMARGET